LKEKLFQGELTTFRCEGCGAQFQVSAPLLYHDMAKQLMIWLIPGEETPEIPEQAGLLGLAEQMSRGSTHRIVRDLNQLIEKIRIFDDELDDKAVEFFKFVIRLNNKEAAEAVLLYDGQDSDEEGLPTIRMALVLEDEVTGVEMPWMDPPSEIVESLESRDAEGEHRWLEVDERFISEILREEPPS